MDGDSETVLRHTVTVARVCGFGSRAGCRVGGVAFSILDT